MKSYKNYSLTELKKISSKLPINNKNFTQKIFKTADETKEQLIKEINKYEYYDPTNKKIYLQDIYNIPTNNLSDLSNEEIIKLIDFYNLTHKIKKSKNKELNIKNLLKHIQLLDGMMIHKPTQYELIKIFNNKRGLSKKQKDRIIEQINENQPEEPIIREIIRREPIKFEPIKIEPEIINPDSILNMNENDEILKTRYSYGIEKEIKAALILPKVETDIEYETRKRQIYNLIIEELKEERRKRFNNFKINLIKSKRFKKIDNVKSYLQTPGYSGEYPNKRIDEIIQDAFKEYDRTELQPENFLYQAFVIRRRIQK